ncbi:hypothetical protein B7494_g628 [Chlorociboria aeruginascens]|nr:hypothetical protein B7494_g628 [Chlorociboria aeruginascens]
MLYYAVDGVQKNSNRSGVGAAYRALSMALIKARPMLAFDHLPPRFLTRSCKTPDEHRHVDEEKSAFYLAMEMGSNELVRFMIEECLEFIQTDIDRNKLGEQSLLQEDVSDPKEYLVAVMEEEHLNLKALQHAINNYIKAKDQGYLVILETLLTFDADGTSKGGRLADNNTLKKAVIQTLTTFDTFKKKASGLPNEVLRKALRDIWCCDALSLPIVQKILHHRSDLKKKDTIMNVLRALTETDDRSIDVISADRRKQLGKGNVENIDLFSAISQNSIVGSVAREAVELRKAQLVEIFSTGAEEQIDIKAARFIVKHNYTNVWLLGSVQTAVALLLKDGQKARNLFRIALDPVRNFYFVKSLEPHIESILDFDLLCEIVKYGRLEVWELPCVKKSWEKHKGKNKDMSMLHTAVEYQKIEFVKHFLREEPGSQVVQRTKILLSFEVNCIFSKPALEKSQDSPSADPVDPAPKALTELRGSSSPDPEPAREATPKPTDPNTEIRKLLVHATIEYADGMKTIAKVFRESELGQICFDLSRFASRLYSVDEFVQSLLAVGEESERHLKFEEVLRYADFPALDLDVWDKKGPEWRLQVHDEVFRALTWLKERGVRKIKKLKVLDRMYSPHDEQTIAMWVRELKVSELDWRHLDMSLSYFSAKTKKQLTDLHLYSSGKTAAVDHWLGPKGIRTLKNLKNLKISLIQDLMTPDRGNTLKASLNRVLRNIKEKRTEFKFKVETQWWNSLPQNSEKDLSEIAEKAVPDLVRYINNYRNKCLSCLKTAKLRRTRVAILDNGILNIPPSRTSQIESRQGRKEGLWPRIEDGQSFVDDSMARSCWLRVLSSSLSLLLPGPCVEGEPKLGSTGEDEDAGTGTSTTAVGNLSRVCSSMSRTDVMPIERN